MHDPRQQTNIKYTSPLQYIIVQYINLFYYNIPSINISCVKTWQLLFDLMILVYFQKSYPKTWLNLFTTTMIYIYIFTISMIQFNQLCSDVYNLNPKMTLCICICCRNINLGYNQFCIYDQISFTYTQTMHTINVHKFQFILYKIHSFQNS